LSIDAAVPGVQLLAAGAVYLCRARGPPSLLVRALSRRRARLPPLRPGAALLRIRVQPGRSQGELARLRPTLPLDTSGPAQRSRSSARVPSPPEGPRYASGFRYWDGSGVSRVSEGGDGRRLGPDHQGVFRCIPFRPCGSPSLIPQRRGRAALPLLRLPLRLLHAPRLPATASTRLSASTSPTRRTELISSAPWRCCDDR